jgi:hypothetical protein
MHQRSTIGVSHRLQRPVHGACVVRGCWCGSTTADDTRSAGRDPATDALRRRLADAAPGHLTAIALRSVGLPVA